jgi:hypothetical protein
MADDPISSDPYDAVLADIDAKIAQLLQTKASIEAVRSGKTISNQEVNNGAAAPSGTQVTAGMFHGMSIVEAVKQLLTMRKKALQTPEITEAIIAGGVVFSTETPGNTVGSVLHRESVKPNGGVISVGRGTWALPTWYSNPGRFRKAKVPGEAPEVDKNAGAGIDPDEPTPTG